MRLKLIKTSLFFFFLLSTLFADLSVTVEQDSPDSNPQIIVNGEAVRPRMFWGAARSSDVEISETWREISFDVSVPFDANSTLHFRFGNSPGDIWLKDLLITDIETGETVFSNNSFVNETLFGDNWNVYPPDERNTVGSIGFVDSSLHITLMDPASGDWPDFHIYSDYLTIPTGKTYHYSCQAKASAARIIKPAVYHVKSGWTYIGGPPSNFEEQLRMAKNAGVNFITFNASNCWLPSSEDDDWSPIDLACQKILNVHPNAWLIPRISMDAPTWWLQENPDAYMVFEDETRGSKASVSHRKYREDAIGHLEKLCRHLTEQFPDNLAGIHPSGQNTGEWFYDQSAGFKLSGYDTATLEAWHDYTGTSDPVPSATERRPGSVRVLLDPVEDENVIAFNHFLQDEMTDFLIDLSNAARRGLGDNKLIMFFYGYHYELASLYNGPAVSGHFALQRMLDTPNIDVLCGPISYNDRGPGGSGPNMSSAESVLRAGKMWLNEDDTRTYLSTNLEDHDRYGGCDTREETQSVLFRNLAQSAIRGYGSWWMDHGAGTSGGWFADEELWNVIDWGEFLDRDMLLQQTVNTPKIAFVLHENSLLHLAGGSGLLGKRFIYDSRRSYPKSGTSFGQYMLEDLVQNGLDSELIIYLSAWALNASEREALIQNRHAGETRVWFYTPGYIIDDHIDIDGMQALTGFEFHKTVLNSTLAFPTDAGMDLGLTSSWGFSEKINPILTVNPDSCTVLARYDGGRTAMAIRESDDGTDVFVGVPLLTDELLKVLVKIAGITPVTEDNTLLWTSPNYTVLHGNQNGDVSLTFDEDIQRIEDGVNGDILANGHQLILNLTDGETRLLKQVGPSSSTDGILPLTFQLSPNYPNPFNPVTSFDYDIPRTSSVRIAIYNVLGNRIDTIVDRELSPGRYHGTWDASSYASGVYILQLSAGKDFVTNKKILLIK